MSNPNLYAIEGIVPESYAILFGIAMSAQRLDAKRKELPLEKGSDSTIDPARVVDEVLAATGDYGQKEIRGLIEIVDEDVTATLKELDALTPQDFRN